MTTNSNRTKTISLSLNFNNENQYHFTVDIGQKVAWDRAEELVGRNYRRERFKLDGLGPLLMRLLVQLDHATLSLADVGKKVGTWNVRAAPKKRRATAVWTDLSWLMEVDPSAKESVPGASIAAPDEKVIEVELSPKAK